MFRLVTLWKVNNHMVNTLTLKRAISHTIILFIAPPYPILLEHMHLTIHGVQRAQVINPLTLHSSTITHTITILINPT